MSKITYSSNNSGGDWWLTDGDWYALELAGWEVDWFRYSGDRKKLKQSHRWLGALASSASREGLTLDEAVEEWESLTGKSAKDSGCECCGPPHTFWEESDL
jgi:hypothetical protein